MPAKLIGFIVTLLIIVTFIGFNIENSSDIRIWFGEKGLLTDVPIFVSFFVMYLIGVVSVIPFVVGWRMKRSRQGKTPDDSKPELDKVEKPRRKKVRILGSKKTDVAAGATETTSGDEDSDVS